MMENKFLLQSSSDSTLCEFEDFNSKTTLRDTLFHRCQVKEDGFSGEPVVRWL